MSAGIALLLIAQAASAGPLGWLEGARCTDEAEEVTCERWGPLAGGTMHGTGQTVRDGQTVGFEFMRIVLEDGTAVFHGSPDGAPAVPFQEAGRGSDWIIFENSAHDYPQRVAYRVEGEALVAEVRERCAPLKAAGVDTVILGCTHYPLVRPIIQRMLGPETTIVTSGAPLARQVEHALGARGLDSLRTGEGRYDFLCTGDPAAFRAQGTRFLQLPLGPVEPVAQALLVL